MSRLVLWSLLVILAPLTALADHCELYFHVDRDAMNPDGVTDGDAEKAAEGDVPVILRRLQAADIRNVQVAQMKHQIRVTLDADAATIDRVKRLVSKGGHLEFLVVSDDQSGLEKDVPGTTVIDGTGREEEERRLRVEVDTAIRDIRISSAKAVKDDHIGWHVEIELDEEGKDRFSKLTANLVKRRLAIRIDGEMMSAPVLMERIANGKMWLQGHFDETWMRELAVILGSGPLPAPLQLVDEKK